MLQTLQKAARALTLFTPAHPEWSVGDMAKALGLPKSSVSELLSSLAEQGLLRRVGAGRYRLGWRLLELGQTLLKTTEFRDEARAVMQEMVNTWGETMHLAVLESGEVVYLEKLRGQQGLQVELSGIGVRLPAHCSGVGKVLLAYQPWEAVLRVVGNEQLYPFTPHTITSLEALSEELVRVRQRGYAYDQEEVSIGLCCVAAPIYDYEGRVIAAVSFSTPTHRFRLHREQYTRAIVEGALRISERLGYYGGTSVCKSIKSKSPYSVPVT
ncbi:IclR family transcriptional regulator [uncultured Chloroflexus sp.]|uniref:IclR family transcriptional regulator n=1 Tax=uncultured Chloroflexus sp. TaxID=214040 RepID=UPI0026282AC5|nr:IclR family transcriptional regulator [uncultured Chloroflexus sp.]